MNPAHFIVALALGIAVSSARADTPDNFKKPNLVAWCIVPFDAAKRSPAERAEMIDRLGMKRIAYDWRNEHVEQFETEILEYKKRGLEMFAFWGTHPKMAELIVKHGIHPQLWVMIGYTDDKLPQDERVAAAGAKLKPLAEQAKQLGCKLALYNHGGWGGEPANMVAVCKWLRANVEGGGDHVGIVYNLHHGHGHIADFPEVLAMMKPYLFCLNLNGMNDGANPKILQIGRGAHEAAMIKTILDSGYAGPIGLLDHDPKVDSEQRLRENLEGLAGVMEKIAD